MARPGDMLLILPNCLLRRTEEREEVRMEEAVLKSWKRKWIPRVGPWIGPLVFCGKARLDIRSNVKRRFGILFMVKGVWSGRAKITGKGCLRKFYCKLKWGIRCLYDEKENRELTIHILTID